MTSKMMQALDKMAGPLPVVLHNHSRVAPASQQPIGHRGRACLHAARPRCAPLRAATADRLQYEGTSGAASLGRPPISDGDACPTFIDESSGEIMEVMCCDYGFRSGNMRLYQDNYGSVPRSVFVLGAENFKKELEQLRRAFRYDEFETVTAAAAPPKNFVVKAVKSAGAKVVAGFASLDRKLQEAGILPELKPVKLPAEVRDEAGQLAADCAEVRNKLAQLQLSNKEVIDYEHQREKKFGRIPSPFYIRFPFKILCWTLDVFYDGRPIQRFWVLETVARIPYFAFISMLHLYETLGWWRAAAPLRKVGSAASLLNYEPSIHTADMPQVHFAEEWNEMHHLQIMEALGGDALWIDRFLAQHGAILYYWVLVGFYLLFPNLAYNFSELVESHASDTYAVFVDANKELLKELPPPLVALEYYKGGDLYMFDDFQTTSRPDPRRPGCNNLYDVFANIRDDELEHVKTMTACEDNSIMKDLADLKANKRESEQRRLRAQKSAAGA